VSGFSIRLPVGTNVLALQFAKVGFNCVRISKETKRTMVKPERGAKSKAIRDFLQTKPDAGPKEIVETLQGQGIKVTAALVSRIKYGKAAAGGKPKRGRLRGNLSEQIRSYLTQNPSAKPKEIREALAKQGFKAAPGLISNVKHRFEKEGSNSRRPAKSRTVGIPSTLTVESLLQVRELANSVGGLDQLRRAAKMLSQLQ